VGNDVPTVDDSPQRLRGITEWDGRCEVEFRYELCIGYAGRAEHVSYGEKVKSIHGTDCEHERGEFRTLPKNEIGTEVFG
jgi:hypothetical protein